MSNRRKLRPHQVARNDQADAYARDPRGERQDRHMAFVRENAAVFSAQAEACYRKYGRGAFVVQHGDEWTPGNANAHYITDENASRALRGLGEGDSGWPDDTTARMVATYDPRKQFVLVINERVGISAYKVRIVPMGSDS